MIMPRLGETVTEGTVTRWLKKEGDTVDRDEMIVEISTDKVDSELPSPVSGVISKILVHEEETVPVETNLAVIDEVGAAGTVSPAPSRPASKTEPTQAVPDKTKANVEVESHRDVRLSPLVRKLARENNVDPSEVNGTGEEGRVTKQDVLDFINSRDAAAGGVRTATQAPAPQFPVMPHTNGERRVPLSHMRRAIAEHMVRSRHTAAHVTAIIEVDMNRVARLREGVKERFKKAEGFSLTFLPFIAKAAIDALQKYPELNSSLDGEDMILRKFVNLGIAVSVPDGLIVPVVRNAESMSLIGLARSIHDVATRAKNKRLKPDEVHEGTFTITNPGGLGSIIQTPIINQPQVGILSLEKVEKRPVVIDDAIAIRWMVYLPLSYDHRVIDGAIAANFLSLIKKNLENWDFAPELGLEPETL